MHFSVNMRHIIITLILLVMSLTVAAQDNDITTWAVEERCVPDPIAVPDDWSYPGTILLSGYAGIHGVRMDWETPHVVAFFRPDSNGNYPIDGGQLSPDNNWYAVPIGTVHSEPSFNSYWNFSKLRIYNLANESQILEFDLADYESIYRYFEVAFTRLPVEWIDNESLMMGQLLFFPFENRVVEASFNTEWSALGDRFLSPDKTAMYGYLRSDDGSSQSGLYNPVDPPSTFIPLDSGYLNSLSWRHDSEGFVGHLRDEERGWDGLAYYDNQGNLIDYILDLDDNRVSFERDMSGHNNIRWSPDNEYFAFTLQSWSEPYRLYILDVEQQTIIDTCLSPLSHPIWSPDGNMLAYVTPARENLKVVVVDLERWQSFDVARHSGRTRVDMVGWRADDN